MSSGKEELPKIDLIRVPLRVACAVVALVAFGLGAMATFSGDSNEAGIAALYVLAAIVGILAVGGRLPQRIAGPGWEMVWVTAMTAAGAMGDQAAKQMQQLASKTEEGDPTAHGKVQEAVDDFITKRDDMVRNATIDALTNIAMSSLRMPLVRSAPPKP